MNVFILDNDPILAAQYHCDKHIVKMPLETAQILSTVVRMKLPSYSGPLYYMTYEHHPCTKWAARSEYNFVALIQLGLALCNEYRYRYEKVHKCLNIINIAASTHASSIAPMLWSSSFRTPNPQCMPPEYKVEGNPIEAYRNYYLGAKAHLLSYTRREIPYWIKEKGLGVQK